MCRVLPRIPSATSANRGASLFKFDLSCASDAVLAFLEPEGLANVFA
jgi:hypothetical protein